MTSEWECIVSPITVRYVGSEEDPPIISKQPRDQSGIDGDEVTLTVPEIRVGSSLSHQGISDDHSDIEDVDTPNLHIHSLSPEHNECIVSKTIERVESQPSEIEGMLTVLNYY